MLNEEYIHQVCVALERDGLIIFDDFLPRKLTLSLSQRAHAFSSEFVEANIGRHLETQKNKKIRSDRTQWIKGDVESEKEFLQAMEALGVALNRHLFLGIRAFESHFAHYKKGAFYEKHLDSFREKKGL